jgi:hypothetical protein
MTADRTPSRTDRNKIDNSTAASLRSETMATSTELPLNTNSTGTRSARPDALLDELSQLKRQLLQAEVRHAKARAAVSGAEADVKVINARLRALTK